MAHTPAMKPLAEEMTEAIAMIALERQFLDIGLSITLIYRAVRSNCACFPAIQLQSMQRRPISSEPLEPQTQLAVSQRGPSLS